eukprot:7034014-Karenia_brevis.AAC.1
MNLTRDCKLLAATRRTVTFKSDAMADDNEVALGGFETSSTGALSDCRWFYVRIERSCWPVIYSKGQDQAFRFTATLELLGTLCGLVAFTLNSPGAEFVGASARA